MPRDSSGKSFRFIGDEIDSLIERVRKTGASYADDPDGRRNVKSAIAELRAFRKDIRKKFFLPTWFLLR
jgi:hypothetical protein